MKINFDTIVICIIFILGFTNTSFSQWEMIYPANLSQSISGIYFVNSQRGWYSTHDGFIYETKNSGVDWKLSNSISPDKLLSISFADSNYGFAYSPYTYLNDPLGLVFTTDGGKSWKNSTWRGWGSLIINTPKKAEIFCYKPNIAFASFESGSIYCSVDTFKFWRVCRGDKYYYPSDYGIPFGIINRYYKSPNGELFAIGNSVSAFDNKIIKDSVAYILKYIEGANRFDTLWCGLKHPIYDLAFVDDSIGWICGSFNTILKTTDKGKTWNYIREPSTFNYSYISLRILDAKTIQVMDEDGNILESSNDGKNLTKIGNVYSSENSRLTFISQNVGFIGSSEGLFKTVDNGKTWKKQTGESYGELRKLDMTDANVGYAVVNYRLYKTTDGGYAWDTVAFDAYPFIRDVEAIDSLNVWAINGYALYHTTTGGKTWETRKFDSLNIHKICFYDSLFGIIYDVTKNGNDYTSVANIVTTDGGITWAITALPNNISNISKMFFLDKDMGWFDSHDGIYRTLNGGKTWEIVKSHIPNGWNRGAYSFHFINQNTGWAAYYYLLYKTNDGGLSWEELKLPSRYETYDIHFLNANIGYAVGFYGDVMSTHDGGNQWSNDFTLSAKPYRSISVTKRKNINSVYIGGDGFIILKKDIVTTVTNGNQSKLPKDYSLKQNYPNPFNPTTTIEYSLPIESKVKIVIFDVLGRENKILVDENKSPGNYKVQFNGSDLSSGMYFYQLQSSDFNQTKKLILMK